MNTGEKDSSLRFEEELSGYVRTSERGIWLFLIGMILLMGSFFFYSTNVVIDDMLTAAVICKDGTATVYYGADDVDRVKIGDRVVLLGDEHHVTTIRQEDGKELSSEDDLFIRTQSQLDLGESILTFSFPTNLEDGYYTASIILGGAHPVILNK